MVIRRNIKCIKVKLKKLEKIEVTLQLNLQLVKKNSKLITRIAMTKIMPNSRLYWKPLQQTKINS